MAVVHDFIEGVYAATLINEAGAAVRRGSTLRPQSFDRSFFDWIFRVAATLALRVVSGRRRRPDPAFVEVSGVTRVVRLSMASPLTMELVLAGLSSAGGVSAVVYLFKNPDKIGSWFPKLQASWYNGRVEAEKAKQAYEVLREARTEIRELEG
jgi:hypothetical protein